MTLEELQMENGKLKKGLWNRMRSSSSSQYRSKICCRLSCMDDGRVALSNNRVACHICPFVTHRHTAWLKHGVLTETNEY